MWLLLHAVDAVTASQPSPQPGCILDSEPGPALTAAWAPDADAVAIAIQGDTADALVIVEARAWFGGLEWRWSTGPHAIHAAECDAVAFSVPPEAFLHRLATDYVTDIWVTVTPLDDNGNRLQETGLRPIYAIWLNGRDNDPTIWDRDALRLNAPHGVLDTTGWLSREPQMAGAFVRYLPPIGQELNLSRTEATDEPNDHVTVPVDTEEE